ncbi:MAG: hypothetical protein AB7U45_05005 [Desulfamplus sp.]
MSLNDRNQLKNNSIWHFIAVISILIAILSLVSPQVKLFGRGLRTTLPAMFVSFFAISIISPMAFIRAFFRFWPTFIVAFLFFVQAALRFVHEDFNTYQLWHAYVIGPIIAFTLLLWIAALAELNEDSILRLRSWILFGWCLSLAVSLPVLINNFGVARLTMGNKFAQQNLVIWAPYGIAEYHVYTALAICMAPLFVITRHYTTAFGRWISLMLLCMASAAVLLSTFTMASVLLILSLITALIVWIKIKRGFARLLRILLVLFLIAQIPFFYTQAKMFPQTEFVVAKVERLYQGISSSGLEKGDETDRGKMFMDSMRSFVENPILGYIPGLQGKRGHGHSSFGDSLAFFGIFGTVLWVFVLFFVFIDFFRHTRTIVDRRVLIIGWVIMILGGILNPTWHSPVVLTPLFALTIPYKNKLLCSMPSVME